MTSSVIARLREAERYGRAVLASDLAIADGGLMVRLWRLLRRDWLHSRTFSSRDSFAQSNSHG